MKKYVFVVVIILSIIFVSGGAALAYTEPGTELPPTTGEQCKKDGWQAYGYFNNQGDCVSYVATGGSNLPSGW